MSNTSILKDGMTKLLTRRLYAALAEKTVYTSTHRPQHTFPVAGPVSATSRLNRPNVSSEHSSLQPYIPFPNSCIHGMTVTSFCLQVTAAMLEVYLLQRCNVVNFTYACKPCCIEYEQSRINLGIILTTSVFTLGIPPT